LCAGKSRRPKTRTWYSCLRNILYCYDRKIHFMNWRCPLDVNCLQMQLRISSKEFRLDRRIIMLCWVWERSTFYQICINGIEGGHGWCATLHIKKTNSCGDNIPAMHWEDSCGCLDNQSVK
jgi:hypothetical protein